MNDPRNDALTRRVFLRSVAGGTAVAGFGAAFARAELVAQSRPAEADRSNTPKPPLPYGSLGRTRYPVTLVSFGAILLSEKTGTRVLKTAIDRGVNLVHTSASYVRGRSIEAIGALFKAEPQYRQRVFLCLKSFHPEKESEIDEMLKTLGTDHADVILTTMDNADPGRIEAIQRQQDGLRKKGKVRHTGFVCHGDMNGVVETVLANAPRYFDVTLLAMRLVPIPGRSAGKEEDKKGQQFLQNLKELRKQGVGILSMKSGARKAVQQGADTFSPHVKMYLEAGADSILTSMDSFEQVAMATGLDLKSPHPTPPEKQAAADFLNKHATTCLMCGDCSKACPLHLPINDLMRCRMYDREYGWVEHARAEYASFGVDFGRLTAECGDCSACADVCPVGLASAHSIRQTVSMLA